MRAVIQRVKKAKVTVEGEIVGEITHGMLVLLGIEDRDSDADVTWLCNKIVSLRIFDDAEHVPNLSLKEVDGGILLVSQFTLFASTKKGNRPGYTRASKPSVAIPVYEKFLHELCSLSGKKVEYGIFGANMQVELVNDGPVTILIDTHNKE